MAVPAAGEHAVEAGVRFGMDVQVSLRQRSYRARHRRISRRFASLVHLGVSLRRIAPAVAGGQTVQYPIDDG